MAQDWLADVRKYAADADEAVVAKIVRYLGIALRNRDSALVSFSSAAETARVRESFLKKKLGLTAPDPTLDAGIATVGDRMKGDRTKNRVTVYYLLADHFGSLDVFGGTKSGGAAPATGAAAAGATALAASARKPRAKAGVKTGAAKVSAPKVAAKASVAKTRAAKPSVAKASAPKIAAKASPPKATVSASPPPPPPPPISEPEPIRAAGANPAAGTAAAGAGATAGPRTLGGFGGDGGGGGNAGGGGSGDNGGGGFKWWPWLLLAAALLILFLVLRSCQPMANTTIADTNMSADATMNMGAGMDNGMDAALDNAMAATPAAAPIGSGVVAEERAGLPALNVYFDTGKAAVSSDLATASAALKAYADANPGATLAVSGFNDPTGNAAANAELSKNRAQAVKAALEQSGIAAERIVLEKPAETTATNVDPAQARRVEVTVRQ